MRRSLVVAAILLGTLAGCQGANISHLSAPSYAGDGAPYGSSPVLEDYVLCGYAIDAVRRVVAELFAAPDDAALIRQTVASYSGYADELRRVSAMATTELRQTSILIAADAADRYAAEVHQRGSYRVDLQPVISASHDAFPGCDLGQ